MEIDRARRWVGMVEDERVVIMIMVMVMMVIIVTVCGVDMDVERCAGWQLV